MPALQEAPGIAWGRWLFPPLTPALSPLRGEGDAAGVSCHPCAPVRVRKPCALWVLFNNAASCVLIVEDTQRAPSPLNGERAGVRGGNSHQLHGIAEASRQSEVSAPRGGAPQTISGQRVAGPVNTNNKQHTNV
jgi:hypothetical protein